VTDPGDHGTHVAGCIASRDPQFRDVAPDVALIDVKITSANSLSNLLAYSSGTGEALRRDPRILVTSLGWSRVPAPALPGHHCPVAMPDGSTSACLRRLARRDYRRPDDVSVVHLPVLPS